MSINNQEIFKTSDLALAAVISIWYPLEAVDKENPHKAQFLFQDSKKLSELVNQYWKRELEVVPQAFFNQLKNIKSRLYGE